MLVHEQSRSLLLRVQDPYVIKAVLPKWRDIDFEGHNLAVPHRVDEIKILRNMGVNAPSPILYYYNWPGPPNKKALEHQKQTAAFLTLYPRCFCFNEPGTMKSASSLWALDYLMNLGVVTKALIVAPNSSLDVTWMDEAFTFLMHRKAVVLVGSKQRRLDLLASNSDIYIINHHGLETIA